MISPLLANLYLHLLDRIWERRGLQQRLGARIIRYANDIVLLCQRGKSASVMTVLRQILERLELTLNEAKTKIVDAYDGKFDFLGFMIWLGRGTGPGGDAEHGESRKSSNGRRVLPASAL
ncbi:MAG: reverse transcriptase domain-containing protein [Desulfobulbaceae bacterium]